MSYHISLKVWALPHPGIGWRARSGEGRQEAGWEWKAHDVGRGTLFFNPLHLIWRSHDLLLAHIQGPWDSLAWKINILQYMAYVRVLRCTQSLGWGLGQGELTGRIWSLQVSLLFLENYIHGYEKCTPFWKPGGRPFCPSMSCPDNWGVTKGDAILVQQQEATRLVSNRYTYFCLTSLFRKEQIEEVQKIQMEKLKM